MAPQTEPPRGEITLRPAEPAEAEVLSALAMDMRRRAGRSGLRTLAVDSDPYARKLYERQGFRYVGETPSGSIPGRTLPRLVCALAPTGGTGINSRS